MEEITKSRMSASIIALTNFKVIINGYDIDIIPLFVHINPRVKLTLPFYAKEQPSFRYFLQ